MIQDALAEALHAAGPVGPHADALQLFGQFVGSWDVVWSGVDAHGKTHAARGELHFGWVLGGRAVQEVWIVPGRGQPGEGRAPMAFHGSSIRFYDAAAGTWKSVWVDPVNGRVRQFTGGLVDGDIVLQSDDERPAVALAVHPHHARFVHLAGRDLARRRRHLDARRGDAHHAQVTCGDGQGARPRTRESFERECVDDVQARGPPRRGDGRGHAEHARDDGHRDQLAGRDAELRGSACQASTGLTGW